MQIIGKPLLKKSKDRIIELFVMSIEGAIWHIRQINPDTLEWGIWQKLGNLNNLLHFTVGLNMDGLFEAFAEDRNKKCWRIVQPFLNDVQLGWSLLADISTLYPSLNHQLSAAINYDGRMEIFSIHDSLALTHICQKVANNDWEQFFSSLVLTTLESTLKKISVISRLDGSLQVFGLTEDHNILHVGQIAAGLWAPINLGPLSSPKQNVPRHHTLPITPKKSVASKNIHSRYGKNSTDGPNISHDDKKRLEKLGKYNLPAVQWKLIISNASDFQIFRLSDGKLLLFWINGNVIKYCYQNTFDEDWSIQYQIPIIEINSNLFPEKIEIFEQEDCSIKIYALIRGDYSAIYSIQQIDQNGWSPWFRNELPVLISGEVNALDSFSVLANRNRQAVVVLHFSDLHVETFEGGYLPRLLPDPPTWVTSHILPLARVNENYLDANHKSVILQTTGQTLSFALKEGSILPDGLSLNLNMGVISGFPFLPGKWQIEIEFIDIHNQCLSGSFTINVLPEAGPGS